MGCDTQKAQGEKLDELISIHAPIVGCDQKKATTETVIRYFNPRTHRGVRRMPYYDKRDREQFQSTHPSWGATFIPLCQWIRLNLISIHAPIVGCDCTAPRHFSISKDFNPRTHRGVRLPLVTQHPFPLCISIHAPIVGCDDETAQHIASSAISIHAPIVGCDMAWSWTLLILKRFQSTHPSWGATMKRHNISQAVQFQSTHPSWGATWHGHGLYLY